MAQNLDQEIEDFNQEALKRELAAVLIIEHQLHAITDDIIAKNPSEEAKQLQSKILIATQESLRAMLNAESREIFLIQQKRFNQLITNLKERLVLDEDLESILEDYRFFNHLLQFLRDATIANTKELNENLPSWFKDHSYYPHWKVELDFLEKESNPRIYDAHKKILIEDLVANESYQDLANMISMSLIEQNNQLLADTRLSYLKETNNRKKLLIDIAWIGVGALLVATAAVLGLAFPPLIIPGLVLGAVVLGYGAVDFVKQSTDLYRGSQELSLGERKIAPDTLAEIEALENTLHDPAKSNFIARQLLEKKHWSREANLIKGAGYTASIAGFVLAITALALIIPGVGVPIAAVIVVTALSLAVAVFAASLLAVRVFREQQHQQNLNTHIDEKIADDEKIMTEVERVYNEIPTKSSIPVLVMQHEKTATLGMFRKQKPPHTEENNEKVGDVELEDTNPPPMQKPIPKPTVNVDEVKKAPVEEKKPKVANKQFASEEDEEDGNKVVEEDEDEDRVTGEDTPGSP
ncbi:EI24 domain-containing protein [Legionella brunensis]|uniref:IncA protein n=1 Tax=Legionella brunensis TaxID=29422 RepID=A0A0W0SDY9_9GAMM|nr:EI24 domain-containing protein [Legionella brunensis]KTC81616.1 IncA protein [Legionella brunensis]